MSLTDIDMMARGGTIALLSLWSWVLIRDHMRALAGRVALVMNVAIICHVFAAIPGQIQPPALNYALELGSVSVPGTFWLFARAWFNDDKRIPVWRIALVVLAMAMVALQMSIFERTGHPSIPLATVMRTAMFGFAIAGIWEAWRGRNDDLVESRRRIRTFMIWSVGLFVILTNVVEILTWRGDLPQVSRTLVEFGIVILAGGLCCAIFSLRQTDLFAAPIAQAPIPRAVVDPGLAQLADKLTGFVIANRSWRDETMSIASLAAQVGEPEYRLRRAINGHLGYRNFAAFLNSYRLDEVRQALVDPSQKDVPILTIALDAGFGSLGPFNRAFREAEGMTPSAFRAASN